MKMGTISFSFIRSPSLQDRFEQQCHLCTDEVQICSRILKPVFLLRNCSTERLRNSSRAGLRERLVLIKCQGPSLNRFRSEIATGQHVISFEINLFPFLNFSVIDS